MKRIALLAIAAAGVATLAATQLTAAEDDAAAKPAASADAPKKEGCDKMKHGGHRWGGPRDFRRRGGSEHGPMGFAHMLNLTEDQKAKVKEVMEANRPKIEAIRKEEMAKIKAVMDDSMKQIEPILTPDQKQVLTDMQKLRESREKLQQDKNKAGQ